MEIKKGNDEDFLKREFIKNKNFIDEKKTQGFIDSHKEVIRNLPEQIREDSVLMERIGEKKCDLHLIVYAHYFKSKKGEKNIFILTSEKEKGNKLRIPYLAKFSKCECVNFTGFLEKEGKKVKLVDL